MRKIFVWWYIFLMVWRLDMCFCIWDKIKNLVFWWVWIFFLRLFKFIWYSLLYFKKIGIVFVWIILLGIVVNVKLLVNIFVFGCIFVVFRFKNKVFLYEFIVIIYLWFVYLLNFIFSCVIFEVNLDFKLERLLFLLNFVLKL